MLDSTHSDVTFAGFQGRRFIINASTIDARSGKHQDKSASSIDEVIGCLVDPDLVAITAHTEPEHAARHIYYRYAREKISGPSITRAVADHEKEPSPVISWSKVGKPSSFSHIVYVNPKAAT